MFVKNLMLPKEKLVTITPKDNIQKALQLIEENHFLSIPVAEGTKFYGSISKEKIYTYYYEKCPDRQCFLKDFLVENVMRTDVPTINPRENMEKAVHFLEVNNVAFVAVVDDGEFVGIVTHHAIFEEFTGVFGISKGKRLAIVAYDVPGQIAKLTSIVSKENADIISLAVVDPKSMLDVREIVMRVNAKDFEVLVEKVKEAGFKVQE